MQNRKRLLITLVLALFLAFTAFFTVSAQDVPDQIQTALQALGEQTDTTLTLNDLSGYTFERREFSDTSLDCPQTGQVYNEVIIPGYIFNLTYDGQVYDYRVSDDNNIVILCSIEPADSPPQQPDTPMIDPLVAIAPMSGTPGTTVDVIANGFPRNTQVVIGIGPPASEYDVIRTARTSNNGVVNTQVIIPDYVAAGDDLVIIVETDDFTTQAMQTFTVMGDDDLTGNPQVTLSALSGAPGTELELVANGFPANSDVLIGIGPQNAADFTYSLRETTDAQGTVTTEFTIPADAQVNRPYIVLVELAADRTYEATSPAFIPTGVATPLPDDGDFTSADIYLIAIGDAGQNGALIGCDDSAIPVQVRFESTIAPLTSALEQLFSIRTRTYGQSGLYNALYRSDLEVQGIDIAAGTATINLTGTYEVGGVCDAPRFIEQIRQTALQFNTIDDVDIFLNGQPIEDALT